MGGCKRLYTYLVFYLSLICFSSVAHAQTIVASDSIDIHSLKARAFSFADSTGVYIAMRDKSRFTLLVYDTQFTLKHQVKQNLDNVLNSDILIGATRTGDVVTILFSSKWHTHFSTLIYDIKSAQFHPGINFDVDDNVYLNWFPREQQLCILAIKKNSSILSVMSLDGKSAITKMQFDLSKERFSHFSNKTLHDVLTASVNNDNSMITSLLLKKVITGSYRTDLDLDDLNKMYYNEHEVFLTLSGKCSYTQVIALDLDQQIYANYEIPFAANNAQSGESCLEGCSLIDHRLVTAFMHPGAISIGVYDLDSLKYIRQWGPDRQSLDSFISSPLIYENLGLPSAPLSIENIGRGTIDTFTDWNKFGKKMFAMPLLRVAASKTANGNIDIYIGAMRQVEKGGGMMMGGGGMMGGGMMMGSNIGSIKPVSYYDEDAPTIRKHYFFHSTLDQHTLQKASSGSESIAYPSFISEYIDDLVSSTGVTRFNIGPAFYLGYSIRDENTYRILRYK